jgi:Zn-finger nucleic acid-binding protein
MSQTVHCPRCRRPLEATGEVTDEHNVVMPVFLCEHCTVPWEFDGVKTETYFSFCVTPDGVFLDAESLERLPLP